VQDLAGDAKFTDITIGQDASTLSSGGAEARGDAGAFGQQADDVTITGQRQTAVSTTAGTFTLNGLQLKLNLGADPKGPRVVKEAGPDDLPLVSARPGLMEGDSLTMYDSTYDGVVEVQTAEGSIRVLKFSMRKSMTEPFSLTIPERAGRTTLIRSDALTVEGNVRFCPPKFTGRLFGLIPVEFTPDAPPPLTLPVLTFTDIRIDLAFVRSDVLTADPLDLRELR
jgi:hypothetical protein